MDLNSAFDERAAVHAARIEWTPSPMPGVERRMLDRIGGEIARATSLVRYAAGSRFPAHVHGGGEEFYVLEGVFSDERGDYPAGTYVRNPPSSRHAPGSSEGCVILVKLWQFEPDDRREVVVDTRGLAPVPAPGRPGVAVVPLHDDAHERVRLEHWAPNAHIELADHGGFEALVLEGSFRESHEEFVYLSWLRLPPGIALRATSGPRGTKLWVKTGHLARPQRAPTV
ncbi:MAG TPA: cupin domain-containing protein [Gammaproteobacteria bacterium]